MTTKTLELKDFARLFGSTESEIPLDCRDLIEKGDFSYRPLTGTERDGVLLDVLKRIDADEFSLAGRQGRERWEKGWGENRDDFLAGAHDPIHLIPKYIRPGQPLRIDQTYVETTDPNFELNWYNVFRLWLFKTYLTEFESIYEFGCGSGFNLIALANLFPEKRFYGLDWASASVEIVDELGKTFGWDMHGVLFDFFEPEKTMRIEKNSAVLTIGALEQTGSEYGAFLEYLLESSPGLCIHVEPIIEWYDENNLIDYAAFRFHQKRNYWRGYPGRLKELERDGKIEIIKASRSFFGSLYIEGYSQIIWKPLV